jgi:hypothetical protein
MGLNKYSTSVWELQCLFFQTYICHTEEEKEVNIMREKLDYTEVEVLLENEVKTIPIV